MIIAIGFPRSPGPDDAFPTHPPSARAPWCVLFAVPKGSRLTATTLTQVLRETHTVAGITRLIVRWDRETGWAHLAIAVPGAGPTCFAGFHRFAGGSAKAVAAELAAAGCVSAPPLHLDDTLSEIEAVLPGVAADARR